MICKLVTREELEHLYPNVDSDIKHEVLMDKFNAPVEHKVKEDVDSS